jgi:hypothetical protein
VGRARALLESAGYRLAAGLTPAQNRAYAAAPNQHHFRLGRADGRIEVELHWELASRRLLPAVTLAEFWPRHTATELLGQPARGFTPTDLALLLALHGSKHCWERLAFVADLAHLLHRCPNLDWPHLRAEARRLRATHFVLLGLHLAHTLLGAALPGSIRAEIEAVPALGPLAAESVANMAGGLEPATLRRVHYHVRLQPRPLDRARYALLLVTAPTVIEWTRWPLPGWLAWSYGLLRPLRLGWKYLGWGMGRGGNRR